MADPLAAALDALPDNRRASRQFRIVELFADRPDVLDAIIRAKQNGRTYEAICETLTEASGQEVSTTALRNWLRAQGVT